MSGEQRSRGVLVVGAGIAGMAAAMHLAAVGERVYLLDGAPAIGGSMHLLDHTFPTNSCGICLMLPRQPSQCPTFECEREKNIELLPYAEVQGVEGEGGGYRVRVRHKARYVSEACDGCGKCGEVCPEARPHDHEGKVHADKAVYRPAGQRAVPERWVVDMGYCTRCGRCVEACPRSAIDLDMEDGEEEIGVAAVLLAAGYGAFDAGKKGEYGYGEYANVVTSVEFERMVSLAGRDVGRLRRPSDGQAPKRVGFVQCVGSRDNLCGAGHCSTACCMVTAKQVAMAKKAEPGLDVTVYTMDVRAMGKGYEEYLAGVQALPGVRYRRAMPSRVMERIRSGGLVVGYVDEDGKLREEEQDLLVLGVGFAPPAGMGVVAEALGVETNRYGFAASERYGPSRTGREGVYVAGAYREPKDIPETVAEAVGAAGEIAAYLRAKRVESGEAGAAAAESRGRQDQRDVSDEEPRVGVYACQCDGGLAPVDTERVIAWAGGLRGVVDARVVDKACTAEGREAIRAAIQAEKLNRVVVAGCSHRPYADEWEEMVRGASLDARLMERVALREQVVYPHLRQGAAGGEALTHKAEGLVGMAVASLRAMQGVDELRPAAGQALERRAVVVGGGAAGMSAALTLAGMGIPVELVERETELGGQWRQIRYQPDGSDVQGALAAQIERVRASEQIRVHLGAQVRETSGKPGAYRTVIGRNGHSEKIEHGVFVVATGGREAKTSEYRHGQHPAVLTQRELEERLATTGLGTKSAAPTVVMIQCVGSREPGRPYCSRVCCTQAVKNALKLKEQNPKAQVYVLYREMRTYGYREAYYEAARDAGVVFVRYEVEDKPEVSAGAEGRLNVRVREPVTGQRLEIGADLVVLSVGIDAEEEGELAERLGVGLGKWGYFQEEHAKMKPLDLGKGGMYVAGLAHSPRFVEETILQGQGAGMRAAAWIAPEEIGERSTSVWVNERLCSFCGLCVEACPYEGRVMDYERRVAVVDYGQCQGCGVCAVVCPNKATKQKAMEHGQVMAAVDMAVA